MTSLPSIPKRAIISIQPDPMGPFEFMNVNDAKEMLNSRHVGGIKHRSNRKTQRRGGSFIIANSCGVNPGSCANKLRGGKKLNRTRRAGTRRKSKRSLKYV